MASSSDLHVQESKRQRLKLYNQRSQINFNVKGLYGPKAGLVEDESSVSTPVEDPSCEHHLYWTEPPEYVLLMKKFHDNDVTKKFKEIARWLVEDRKVKVVCEPNILKESLINQESFKDIKDQLLYWNNDNKSETLDSIDLIVCVGGDGTLLYTSGLFQDSMPPIISFHMGSLGFLTPFQLDTYKTDINRVFNGHPSLTLRHRLSCEIRSHHQVKHPLSEAVCEMDPNRDEPITPMTFKPVRPTQFETKLVLTNDVLKTKVLVMNEVVVDRGPSPYLTNLEFFCNGRLMTSVQGDGIIIASPTGSTAYSLAAGSSMVHPSVPCMLVTPICPHSLSFRSIVVPSGVEITIRVGANSRSTAWVGFDGRNRQEIYQGDSVVVSTSPYPVPAINNTGHVTDWFDSLGECLQWNVRKQQKIC